MKKLLTLFAVIILSGCATTANYEKILNTWVGSPVDNLVMSWGPPQNSYDFSNGGKVIEYTALRSVMMGGYSYTSPQRIYYSGTSTRYVRRQTPRYNIALSCQTRFTINSAGIITKWSWQGNDCKASVPK